MTNLSSSTRWAPAEDVVLFGFRLFVGAFLAWGVWDNIVSMERMAEFEHFLAANGFAWPGVMAALSVWVQFGCAVSFAVGVLTRWAGWLCAVNFLVALVMVDAAGGFRQAFPAAMLMLFGLYLAARGAGRYSVDNLLRQRKAMSSV